MPGAEVQYDTGITAASLSRTVKGDEVVRMAQVTGLDATINDGHRLLTLAVEATGIVVGVDFHPSRTELVCTRIDARHMTDSPSKVELTITYGIPIFDFQTGDVDTDQPQITGGVVVQSVTTSRDVHGHPIKLFHQLIQTDENGVYKKNPKHPDNGGTLDPDSIQQFKFLIRRLESVAKIEVLMPMYTFGLTRRESTSPGAIAQQYVGTTSHKVWFGFPRGTVLCTGITFTSNDGGATFNTTYSFQENREGWLADVAITDPETGEFAVGVPDEGDPLADPATGALISYYTGPPANEGGPTTPNWSEKKAARRLVRPYRQTNFHRLGLLRSDPRPIPPPGGRR